MKILLEASLRKEIDRTCINFVVFGMGTDKLDKRSVTLEVKCHNNPIIVALNPEYDTLGVKHCG
jgi:hypothetical protein